MNQQIDLYIEEARKSEVTGNVELDLITKINNIPQDRNAQVTQTSLQHDAALKLDTAAQTSAPDAQLDAMVKQHPEADAPAAAHSAAKHAAHRYAAAPGNCATNWWLALIAFLLFLILIFND